ncbi:DNA-directed RNA polymerase III subunit rpc5 [Fusarium albosuccineum]|uniref:DNA-directed RNA polymerase III subunit rpc5 n=1 Tax=Fusarium albosuccineum TaxID=1237068 RepID=A0A8H4PCF6_9HYPO|nr:DNA-directed RNA polymerase III subunit rpc5 [Fusarium albosuccineum]
MAAPTTLPALLTSLTQSLSSALEVTPKLAAIEHQKDGISLLDVKNELLLSYLQNLVFLILLKLRNSKTDSETQDEGDSGLDESVRSKLVELRLYLERGARPLEEKLRFSIDRFLRTADDAERERKASEMKSKEDSGSGSEEEDSEEESDAEDISHKPGNLSAAPKFGKLVDDVTARQSREDGASGVYRPPKRDRQVMDAPQRRDKTDRRGNKSHTMEEFVSTELSAAPLAEPSIGTTIVQGGRKMKTDSERKEEAERREYEEMNFTRLPKESKKDKAQKAKQAGRSGRMQFGGEEWHNLGEGVDRIDRLTKRKQAGSNVRALLDKSRKRGIDTTDGPRGSGMGPGIGERFNKRVKVLEGGRRDRGKNRSGEPAPAAPMDLDDMDIDSSLQASTTAQPTTTTIDDDDDPVTATYNVFINPSLPQGRRLLVLQHPNRTDDAPRPPPTELRVKAHAGMVEVDVPLDHSVAYDREKGLKWGKTLHASMAAKNGGSHGLAGGFGFGTVQGRGGRKKAETEDDENVDWTEAVRQDKVLRTQTLGGQYPEYKEVQHMVGVFQGKDLHLTPVSSLVHLRPQLHHIDATTQIDRQAAASKDSAPASGTGTARAIHMTVKTTGDGDAVTTETMADRLRAVQSEHWRTVRYTDENEEAAWEVYNESLFLRPAQESEGDAEKADAAAEDERPLQDAVPRFGLRWDDDQLLEAVSGIEKKKPAPEPVIKEEPKPAAPAKKPEPEAEEVRKPKLRPRGGAATGAARRGGKARATTSKTVNID